jgi:AMP deaminase
LFSVAAQVWKLSAIDMSEIARNSVLQSGFEQQFKAHWIGNNYWKRSLIANDIRQTNVPDMRIQYRAELLGDEFRMLHHHTKLVFDDSLIDRII